ncbi:hypothetical protein [Mesorhizobium sp. B4-1-4]|uniref:hypothetical protein n=1 Tax=Mesorhizobium sp. B4-1-4 TaxID=2589888 RepID=UPI00112D408B|nr:hypothetical protein [Mesorhizobium sp. B4-1-4]UCI30485.1 hypothetical protein FJW03_22135 [Mesorhizobium sp. B4-1-4]
MDRRIERMRACRRADCGLMKAGSHEGPYGLMTIVDVWMPRYGRTPERRPRRGYDPAIGQTLNKVLI